MTVKPLATVFKPLAWVAILLVPPGALEGAALGPAGVEQFFATPGEPAVLRFRVESGELGDSPEYTLRDYGGKPVLTGRAKKAAAGVLEATVRLEQGFLEIDFPAAKQRFGIVALPAWQGKAEPFFAIDGALSWLVREDAVREGLVQAARRVGIAMIRERLTWGAVHPAPDRWDWDTGARFDALRRACAGRGVEVLEMAHDGPQWMGRVGKYPADLVQAARSWRAIAGRWRPTWGGLEVWNEPDIFFGANLPADQYVPLAKALSYGLKEAKIDVPVVGGVMAHCNRKFLDTCGQSGLLDCIDAFSFHTYGRAAEMESLVGQYRQWLRDYKHGEMPLWITECGRPWQTGPDRPPPDQDAASALDITMKGIEARACGVARYFPFVYPYYVEGKNNFGMMDRQATPLRSIAAYAQMIRALAGKRCLGDLKHQDPAIRRARLFGDDRHAVAVLYTGKAEAAKVRLDLPAERIEAIDGRKIPPASDGTVAVPDGLVYVWLDRGKLGERLVADTPAMRLHPDQPGDSHELSLPTGIILRYQYDPALVAPTSEGYRIKSTSAGKMPLGVRVFNLADRSRNVTVKLDAGAGPAGILGPASQTVKIEPRGSVDVAWKLDPADRLAAGGGLRLQVAAFDTPAPSRSEPARPADTLALVFTAESRKAPLQ